MELLGVPIVVNAQYFDKFAAARFDKVKHLQDLLLELEDSPSTYGFNFYVNVEAAVKCCASHAMQFSTV